MFKNLLVFVATATLLACGGGSGGGGGGPADKGGGGGGNLSADQEASVKSLSASMAATKTANDKAKPKQFELDSMDLVSSSSAQTPPNVDGMAKSMGACKFDPIKPEFGNEPPDLSKPIKQVHGFRTGGPGCPVTLEMVTTSLTDYQNYKMSTESVMKYSVVDGAKQAAFMKLNDVFFYDMKSNMDMDVNQSTGDMTMKLTQTGSITSQTQGLVTIAGSGTLVGKQTQAGEKSMAGALETKIVFKDFTAVIVSTPYLDKKDGKEDIKFHHKLNGKDVTEKELEGFFQASPTDKDPQ